MTTKQIHLHRQWSSSELCSLVCCSGQSVPSVVCACGISVVVSGAWVYDISTEYLSWEKDRIRHAEIANFSNMRRKRKNHVFKVLYTWMNGSAAVAARQCRAVPAFSVALVLPSLYYIEAEVESGCYCNEDTMCSIQPLLGACKKFCSHTTQLLPAPYLCCSCISVSVFWSDIIYVPT